MPKFKPKSVNNLGWSKARREMKGSMKFCFALFQIGLSKGKGKEILPDPQMKQDIWADD